MNQSDGRERQGETAGGGARRELGGRAGGGARVRGNRTRARGGGHVGPAGLGEDPDCLPVKRGILGSVPAGEL